MPAAGDAPAGRPKQAAASASAGPADAATGDADQDDAEAAGPARAPAIERRRAAEALITLWTDVARDVALCQRGLDRSIRDLALLDDVRALAVSLDPESLRAFIDRLGRASVLIAANASPELVLDDLVLAWPGPRFGSRAA